MKTTQNPALDYLQNENLFLRNTNENLQKENLYFKNQNEKLTQELNWLKKQLFGKKSERIIPPSNEEQLYFEGMKPQEEPIETQIVKEHKKRKKQKRDGKYKISLPDDLPIKTHLLDLSEEEKICPITKKPLIKIGEETSDKLAYIPGSYYIKRFIRPKYSNKEQIFTSEMR
jgi:transposase